MTINDLAALLRDFGLIAIAAISLYWAYYKDKQNSALWEARRQDWELFRTAAIKHGIDPSFVDSMRDVRLPDKTK